MVRRNQLPTKRFSGSYLCEGTIQTIASGPMALEKAMAEAAPLLEAAADRVLRAVKIGIRLKDAV